MEAAVKGSAVDDLADVFLSRDQDKILARNVLEEKEREEGIGRRE
jgi:hypothetical protein